MPNCHKGKTLRFVVSTCVGLREFLNANEIHISWGKKKPRNSSKRGLSMEKSGVLWGRRHMATLPVLSSKTQGQDFFLEPWNIETKLLKL